MQDIKHTVFGFLELVVATVAVSGLHLLTEDTLGLDLPWWLWAVVWVIFAIIIAGVLHGIADGWREHSDREQLERRQARDRQEIERNVHMQEERRRASLETNTPEEKTGTMTTTDIHRGTIAKAYRSLLLKVLLAWVLLAAISGGLTFVLVLLLLGPQYAANAVGLGVAAFILVGFFTVPIAFNMLMGRLDHDSSPTRSRRLDNDTKQHVYARDKGRCQQCWSMADLEYDHIVPFSKGGNNSVNNIRLLCRKCNRRRGARGGGWL